MASTTTKTAGILIGRTRSDPGYRRLIEGLRRAGFRVIERSSSPIGAHISAEDLAETLHGIDVALIVVRDADDLNATGSVRPFQRVARDIGLLQGKLGVDRVILLVEPGVSGLGAAEFGATAIPVSIDGPEESLHNIIQRIIAMDAAVATTPPPPKPAGMGGKLSSIERAGADMTWVPIALVLIIGLMALIGAMVVGISIAGGDGGDGEDGSQRAQLLDVADALRTNESAPDGMGTIGEADPTETAGEQTPRNEVLEEIPAPAGPSTGDDTQLLPASCEIDLGPDAVLSSATVCDGAGVLVLDDGSDGPWYDDLVAVALSDGVVGEVSYASGGREALEVGLVTLDPAEATVGVTSITVSFSAAGQHVHLFADPSRSGREATLTLRLDR